jgi:sRNA-binding carbon storage regulator CsrA
MLSFYHPGCRKLNPRPGAEVSVDDELEAQIVALVKAKGEVGFDTPEHRMIVRMLNGLRMTREGAEAIWEKHDPFWEPTHRPPDPEGQEAQVLPLSHK